MEADARVRVAGSLRDALGALGRPPFRLLLVLSIVTALAAESFGGRADVGGPGIALFLLLVGVGFYVQIATTLAAGANDPAQSTDDWIRAAVRRRCFLRFAFTNLLTTVALVAGLALFVVPVFVVGAVISLSHSAAVLERRTPIPAVFRSAQLSKGARVPLGIVFSLLVLVPTVGVNLGVILGLRDALGPLWSAVVGVGELFAFSGVIALTRIFVTLGGQPTPALQDIAPRQRGRR